LKSQEDGRRGGRDGSIERMRKDKREFTKVISIMKERLIRRSSSRGRGRGRGRGGGGETVVGAWMVLHLRRGRGGERKGGRGMGLG
jgi:hypothetical protein